MSFLALAPKVAAGCSSLMRSRAPSTPTRTQKKKVHWSPDVIEKSRPPRVGLVCTLKDASKRLDSFIRYHQRVGFAQIYLYFDDATETADIEAARGYADVEVIARDDALAEAWANLPGWAALKDYVQGDVQVRQMLNALHCLRWAEARDRLQWLVHVDSDELFDPGARSIHDHFRYLEASRFDWFCYHNFEAVPEVAYQTEVDPFLTVSLFKRGMEDFTVLQSTLVHFEDGDAEVEARLSGLRLLRPRLPRDRRCRAPCAYAKPRGQIALRETSSYRIPSCTLRFLQDA